MSRSNCRREWSVILSSRSGNLERTLPSLLVSTGWKGIAAHTNTTAMNVSFFFLIMVLVGLGAMTNWMKEVVFLLVTSVLLWGAMVM